MSEATDGTFDRFEGVDAEPPRLEDYVDGLGLLPLDKQVDIAEWWEHDIVAKWMWAQERKAPACPLLPEVVAA